MVGAIEAIFAIPILLAGWAWEWTVQQFEAGRLAFKLWHQNR